MDSQRDTIANAENAREGYQAAIALWTYQGTLNWSRFNVMLTANSIIIAVIGIAFSSGHPLPGLSFVGIYWAVFPMLGLALCVAWLSLVVRGEKWHQYWGKSACELEEKYLNDAVKMVARARLLSGGEPISLVIGGEHTSMRMGYFSRMAQSQKWVPYLVIGVFAVAYSVIWVFSSL